MNSIVKKYIVINKKYSNFYFLFIKSNIKIKF